MSDGPVPANGLQDEFRRYAEIIVDAPAEWTPHFTRSELLPLARAYLENERLREALAHYADRTNWGITRWADGPHMEFLTVHEEPWARAANALEGGNG